MTESIRYDERPPSIIELKKDVAPIQLEEIAKLIDQFVPEYSELAAAHKLGRLYKTRIKKNSTSIEILIALLDSFLELLQKELQYNNQYNDKTLILKKSIQNMVGTLEILKSLELDCKSEHLLTLLRSFCV